MSTQGFEANESGRFLENACRAYFLPRGFIVKTFSEDADNADMFASQMLVLRDPYTNLAGLRCYSDLVIIDNQRRIRLECKWQDTPGSVDEKLFGLFFNLRDTAPEYEIVILHGGNGARVEIIRWLEKEAKLAAPRKKIWVLNINDFPLWVRREFLPRAA